MQECNTVYGFDYEVVISLINMYKHLNTLNLFCPEYTFLSITYLTHSLTLEKIFTARDICWKVFVS